jgi:uncharacterized membrane protein YsdA (DUF1294 family)
MNSYTFLLWVLVAITIASAASIALYKIDKAAAAHGGWRVPEKTLHLIALAGGSPGAYYAQRKFRHKTKKKSFQAVYWSIVLFQIASVAFFMVLRHGR